MKKYILIDHEPWTVRRKELFLDLFNEAGIKLEVWDLSQWLHPGLQMSDEINGDYLTKVKSKKEFSLLLKSENPNSTILVEEIIKVWKNRKIYRLISDFGFDTLKIDQYGNGSVINSLRAKLANLTFSSLPGIIKRKFLGESLNLYDRIFQVKKPIRVFSSNKFVNRTDSFNHPDYERFRFMPHSKVVEGRYIVFCDTFFPYHPDLRHYYNLKNLPDGKKYQESMKCYFDFLESKYGIPVIIAAHPKADYMGNEFGSRRIIKYQTDNLIAHSDMVTLHICNSISYSILFDKPIAYVGTADYLKMDNVKRLFPILANQTLGLEIYNIDKVDYSSIQFKKVDPELRRNYILNYLTSNSTKDLPNAENLKGVLANL